MIWFLMQKFLYPLLYKMAITTTKQKKLAYTITNNVVIETEKTKEEQEIMCIKLPVATRSSFPDKYLWEIKLTLTRMIRSENQVFTTRNPDEEVTGKLAFNYDRTESDMSMYSETELTGINPTNPKIKVISSALQSNISGTITQKDKGIVLWKWFIIAALIFLAVEALLLRYFKIKSLYGYPD